ncbi:hypothetical protein O181_063166 [Austropuccinia psidii MF-1]|uniref:Uncharacterized protein n=1 Tax=Austropuccinia psidii MF-1 TaxID=1389203 RepID=A0A9Q3HZ62_9BASI|nr:hypothetical protein [Austropuccinia psidii MF-1]
MLVKVVMILMIKKLKLWTRKLAKLKFTPLLIHILGSSKPNLSLVLQEICNQDLLLALPLFTNLHLIHSMLGHLTSNLKPMASTPGRRRAASFSLPYPAAEVFQQ